jgi:hypothetical protein
MVASPMLNNQNYQKGGGATMKEKTKTLTTQTIDFTPEIYLQGMRRFKI